MLKAWEYKKELLVDSINDRCPAYECVSAKHNLIMGKQPFVASNMYPDWFLYIIKPE